MPIEGVSDIVRLPRLGKIRLGIKVEKQGKNPYPQATDYFVCPPEVQSVFGDKPRELEIMFPVEEPELFAQQWLRCYSLTHGLVCIGNGIACRRKVDTDTGTIASRDTKHWTWKDDLVCDPDECPEYGAKRCRRVMNLLFLMPKVEGLGVWQIDTTSFHSIVNINGAIKLVKNLCGRISFIPLTLCLTPRDVNPPNGTRKTVNVLNIKQKVKLYDLLQAAQKEPARLLLPEPEVEEPPEDLYPKEVLQGEVEAEEEREVSETKPNIMEAWQEIRTLLESVKVDEQRVKNWWKMAYNLDVTLKDFSYVRPPEKFGGSMISIFRDKLREVKKEQSAQQLKLQ